MFEYTQFSIKVHYYNKRGLKICLICYKLFRCSENYELQRWQLLQPSSILLKSRFRICNLKLYKLVDDLSLLDSFLTQVNVSFELCISRLLFAVYRLYYCQGPIKESFLCNLGKKSPLFMNKV